MDLNSVTAIARPRHRSELDWRPGDAFLAGGTWLFSEPQPMVTRLVDLAGLGWPALEALGQGLRIAATCTLAQLAAHEAPGAGALFGQCCAALLGSFKIWNAATVGGNLCLALPAAPMAALVTALDGTCVIRRRDGTERRLPAIDFVLGPGRCALRDGEVLRAIDLPGAALRARHAFRQISLTPLGRSAALLIGTRAASGFALTIAAATTRPLRLAFAHPPGTAELAHNLVGIPHTHYFEDVHGERDWRRHMVASLGEEIRAELHGP